MRRKRTSPQEQLRLIQACRQSGLTDFDWCQAHGIPPATFYGWIHRLKQKGEMEVPSGVPTIVRKEAGPPDIVKIEIEAEGEIAQDMEGSPSACKSGMAEEVPAPCLDSNCKNRHPSPICTRFEHHFHALKPHLHRRSFSDTLPENQRHLIALKRHPLWHMQKLCQLSQPAELRSTFFRNRNAVLCQDVLQLSNPLALSLEFFLSCVKVFHRLTLHLVVAGPFQF